MKIHLLGVLVPITLIGLAIMSGCAGPVVVSSATPAVNPTLAASSLTSATPDILSVSSPTATGVTGLRMGPTAIPAQSPTLAPSHTFSMTPSQITVAAGESAIITGGPADSEWKSTSEYPTWQVDPSVRGAPPGTTIAGLDKRALGFVRQFAIMTSCLTPPGSYTLTFHTTTFISDVTWKRQSAQVTLTVNPRVMTDSPMGTFTTSRQISLKFGERVSEYRAVVDSVTLCDTNPRRRLRVIVRSATSKAGTPMKRLPSVGIFRALTPDAVDGIYRTLETDALPVTPNDLNERELAGGHYVIVFGQYDPEHPLPDDQVVGSVTYTLKIAPSGSSPVGTTPTPTVYPFSMTPAQVTIPRGGALIITAGPISWNLKNGRFPQWGIDPAVEGLPPGVTAQAFGNTEHFNRRFGIITSCLAPPGTYPLTFHGNGDGITESAQMELTISPKAVPDSPMGTFTTSQTIDIRYGGPSSMESGIAATVTLCEAIPPRRLRITVQAATSKAGTPMASLPGYELYRELSPDAEREIWRLDYLNAVRVESSGEAGEWSLSGGPYIIVFDPQRWASWPPPEQELASVTYTLEIVPSP